jgi:WD40 repeat protein
VLRNAKTKYTAVTFSADGKIIAAGNKEGDIKVWNSVSYVEMNSLSPSKISE